LLPQQLWQPPADPHPPRGQWLPQGEAAEPDCEQDPPQLAPHVDCEQDVLAGQLQFPVQCPACPRVNPIPANSRTININAIFLNMNTHSFFLNWLTVRALRSPCGLWLFGFRQMPLQFTGNFRCNLIKIARIINTFVAIFPSMYTNMSCPIDIRMSKPQEKLGA
jgi:hypothetical protein